MEEEIKKQLKEVLAYQNLYQKEGVFREMLEQLVEINDKNEATIKQLTEEEYNQQKLKKKNMQRIK